MITISRDKLLERWDSLPTEIQDAVLSDTNDQIILSTCKKYGVPDKTELIAELVSYALFGYINYLELGNLIAGEGIAKDVADKIAGDITANIITPVRHFLGPIPLNFPSTPSIPSSPTTMSPEPTITQTLPVPPAQVVAGSVISDVEERHAEITKTLKPSFGNEPFVFHKAVEDSVIKETPDQPTFGIGYKIVGPDIKSTAPVLPANNAKPRVVNYSEFRTPLEKSEAAQPPIQSTPENQQINPAIPSQNIVNLKKNEQVPAEPSKENTENTINLKDLPL